MYLVLHKVRGYPGDREHNVPLALSFIGKRAYCGVCFCLKSLLRRTNIMSGAKAWNDNERHAAKEGEKGKVEMAKVRRYRPGKVPEWMAPGADMLDYQGEDILDGVSNTESMRRKEMPQIVLDGEGPRRVTAPTIVKKKNGDLVEPRVHRAPRIVCRAPRTNVEERHDTLKGVQTKSAQEEEEDEDEDDNNNNDGGEMPGISDIEDSDDDYTTTGSEESDAPLAKPVFVRKMERKTLEERDAIEREELERIAQEKVRAARQAQETRKIAAQKLEEEKAQEEAAKAGPQGADEIITDDEMEPEEDYERWKERELERLRRNFESKLKRELEEQEKEIWRNMSDAEKEKYLASKTREAEKESHFSKKHSKKNWSFLQKYYHKGAFFQDEAEYKGEKAPLVGNLKQRDFSAPTGEDVFDKKLLPEVMRVKNFGKRSQSKWTHLAAEDTTRQAEQSTKPGYE